VLVLVIVLAMSNVATLAALLYLRYRPTPLEQGDPAIEAALAAASASPGAAARTRQLISIEILNPIELAGSRGRVLGVAGSFAPAFTRRVIYDRTSKIIRQQLAEQRVVADVHVHTLRPIPSASPPSSPAATPNDALDVQPVGFIDEVDVPAGDESARPQPPT
jgi:hypothetical protein